MTDQNNINQIFEERLVNCVDFSPVENYEQQIEKLASLSFIAYDQQRKEVAKQLNIRLQTLDEAVARKRPVEARGFESLADQTLFPEIEVWDHPVSGDELLQELEATFRTFIILPDYADTALALWVVFTWLVPLMDIAPILAISSPEKRCGKTTLLSLLSKLVLKPLPASNITPACVFRVIEKWHPTLLIDEADSFIGESEELRGILNSGHTRPTAFVIRSVGDDHTPKRFSTWGAKAIALIGKLPDTLHDRSVVITLKRKHGGEKIAKLREANEKIFLNLARKLKRFSQDYAGHVKGTHLICSSVLVEQLSDRAMDNWEPLLIIAGIAGKIWIEKAHKAALALSSCKGESDSKSNQLLSDIQQIFIQNNFEKISTADLILHLCKDEERPWGTYNRGKALSQMQLAKLLKLYHIDSKNIRIGNNIIKGFEKRQFEDAWERYISSSYLSKIAATPATPLQTRYTAPFSVASFGSSAATPLQLAMKNTRETAACSGVAAKFRESGKYKNESEIHLLRQKNFEPLKEKGSVPEQLESNLLAVSAFPSKDGANRIRVTI